MKKKIINSLIAFFGFILIIASIFSALYTAGVSIPQLTNTSSAWW